MASTSNPVMNGLQNGQPDLDQDRRRWFNDFEGIKARFEAEKETIRSRFLQQQRDACTDLDDEARYADMPGLPQKAHDLIQKYQNELRSHRWAACQHRFDEEEKDRVQRERDALREHHILFPIPGPSGHNGHNGPNARRPSTTTTKTTTATLPSQTPPNGRMALPSEMLTRATPSSSLANIISQPRQPLSQGGTGMPSHTTHPNQHGLSRQANGASGDASSAQMQHQQLLNQTRQPQQPMGQSQRNPHNQHIPHNPNWPHHGQPGPQQGSPRISPIYQNRPVNGSTVANGPPRVLASQVQLPMLGSNHYGHMRIKPSARPLAGGDPADSMHGNRVPLPPIHTPAMGNRDDRLQAHNGRNMTQLPTPRADDMARQAMDIHRLAKRKSDASDVSARDAEFKRARLDSPHSIAPRTITFQEVYQDGKAEFKHNIVKYDDVFYILRCDEHGVHFKQNALAAAAKHLHGASHGHQKKEHKLAVETIGFHVVDCTEELAALNNACVRQAFENGYKPLNQLHGPKSGGKRHSGGIPAVVDAFVDRAPSVSQSPFQAPAQAAALENVAEQDETEQGHQQEPKQDAKQDVKQDAKQDVKQDTKQEDSMPTKYILNPKAGELYHARWPRSSKLYIVMVLGWTDLRMCGWEAKLSETQLYDKKIRPSCYTYNDDGIAGWASGFGDGEPRVLERDVPVLWFESKGKTRLGWLGVKWLLKPMTLDDPSRPTDPDNPSNQARKTYAEIRGYDSFEAMLAASGTEGAVPTTTKVPSSASASDSDSTPDVDMYEFGDNPPAVDDSDDEDYVEGRSRKGRVTGDGGDEDDDETADAAERPVTPQPLRRSTQEVRPSSRLGGGGWPSGRMGAAAGTRLSARKDKSTADDKEDVTMEDARQTTPLKNRSTGDATPKAAGKDEGLLPNVALGSPADPVKGDNIKAAGSDAAVRADRSASENNVFPPGSKSGPAERATLSELSRSNPHERCNAEEGPETADAKTARDGEKDAQPNHAAAMAKLAQSAMKAASKSPSLDREAAQINLVLQVANLLNSAPVPERVTKQPSSGAPHAKPNDARRPLPSGPGMTVIVAEPATIPRSSMSHDMTTGGSIGVRKEDANQQPSVDLTVQSNQEAETQPARCGSAGSGDSAARRSDPRMSISNAVDDHKDEGIKRTEAGLLERNATEDGNNGGFPGNNTSRILAHIGLANDARWRAVRTSESPQMPAAMVQSAVIDRGEAASPALSGKKEAETSIDVAEFHEGDRHWAQEGRFLRFVLDDESSGIARSVNEDGMEVTVDASQVKAAQMTGSEVRLVLKTGGEQRLVFSANALTGSHRGARMQTAKFYRWVTGRNTEIEHIG